MWIPLNTDHLPQIPLKTKHTPSMCILLCSYTWACLNVHFWSCGVLDCSAGFSWYWENDFGSGSIPASAHFHQPVITASLVNIWIYFGWKCKNPNDRHRCEGEAAPFWLWHWYCVCQSAIRQCAPLLVNVIEQNAVNFSFPSAVTTEVLTAVTNIFQRMKEKFCRMKKVKLGIFAITLHFAF